MLMNEIANNSRLHELAQAAAQQSEKFVASVRSNDITAIRALLAPASVAFYLLEIFGLALFRLDLRLDDPQEAGQLAPYDLQIEGEVALLELGVLEPLKIEGVEDHQHSHLRRLFGSSLLLHFNQEWQIAEVLPFNSNSTLNPQNPTDKLILETHQGKKRLPLQLANLDETEQCFLKKMLKQAGRFNLEEAVNALRLWRDFKVKNVTPPNGKAKSWAAGVEYLITLFDFHQVELKTLVVRYTTGSTAILDQARELAQTLNVTQFDDRYSIHPDPIAHYRTLFGEIGVEQNKPKRNQVFDTIEEVPLDDEDFWGPR
ncbi:MAG: hypothetical protein HXX20_18170 [Chloroflexi bacterium]|nr:hypothetical protein [Chloroflexota bacterium]